jgi:branched-chain amino acid transport system ATP-binding protein
MLDVQNIEVVYNRVIPVLHGISFQVAQGQAVTLMGSNGAGKSTTLKAISGLLKNELGDITRGRILWQGQRIDALPAEEVVRRGIVQVIEGRPLFRQLSVEENLKTGGMVYKNGRETSHDLERVYQYFPRLKVMRRRTSGFLSGGEQQMLVIGRALMSHPKLMMLDEPSLGLAPLMVEEIFSIVRDIREKDGLSVLLVEQNAHAALSVAEYGYVIEQGRVVLNGTAEMLKNNEDIKEFYLGLSQKSYRNLKHYKRRKRWTG